MRQAFEKIVDSTRDDISVSIYYAYKQTEANAREEIAASTGWETMLAALIDAGFAITGTWPMRTELTTALKGQLNALASSIVLVCRKRSLDAPIAMRRQFFRELEEKLPPALRKLQEANIAPVDLAQAAIGPGMEIFSKYSQVLEADGTPLTVRQALQAINAALDSYFAEQEGYMDAESRFCIALFTQFGFNDLSFGQAEVLSKAKNTSIEKMAKSGALSAEKGIVRLLCRDELPQIFAELTGSKAQGKLNSRGHELGDNLWLLAQYMTRTLEYGGGGEKACAILARQYPGDADQARDLAYRLYAIAERKGWAREAQAYNELVTSWPAIMEQSRTVAVEMEQGILQG